MPHSSGGGSHGGGFHSGSSGSGSSSRSSSRYFEGSHRYVYYYHNRPYYYYSDAKPPETKTSLKMMAIVCAVIAAIISVAILLMGYRHPKKLKTDYEAVPYVEDRIDVMTDAEEAKLTETLEDFLKLTGIAPVIVTEDNASWQGYYTDLEQYAYDLYVNSFPDEKHWLVVYTQPAAADDGFVDWYWQGMQGDDTDGILDTDHTDAFGRVLQRSLTDNTHYSIYEAFDKAFSDMIPSIMEAGLESGTIATMILADFVMLIITIIGLISTVRDNRKVGAIRCQTDKEQPMEDTCEYCGGVYVHGIHLSCPHCGAPIKALNSGAS